MRNDVLLDIATFLARRWSGNDRTAVAITADKAPATKPDKSQISLPALSYYVGTDFQRYRQWRVALWYESMRMRHSSKVLSNEHAFGFILNTLETKRIEILGLRDWEGMEGELIFNEGISWQSRQLLNTIYGRYKVAEAFSQYFLTGYVKGELFGGELDRVQRAAEYATEIVNEAIAGGHGTGWLEQHVPKLIKMLELDPLVSIPILAPKTRMGASLTQQSDVLKQIEKIVRTRKKEKDAEEKAKEIYDGTDVLKEFEALVKESKKTENKGYDSLENFGLSVPDRMDVDETRLYDLDLIQKVKAAFRAWKTGWTERHDDTGDELDAEVFAESLPKPFLTDVKLSIKTKVVLLLDHSSSIADVELEYKQATVALCEALSYLGVKFAVYAFSTENRQVKAWVVKPPNVKWSLVCARRLAQIKAVGGTPLAEVYALLQPALKSFRPDIFVTLTDGEPSDFDAVRAMVLSYRKAGVKMVAIGVGRNLNDAVGIGHNLKYLNYERALAVSRLQDMPKKVIGLLRS
ncbi:vWA domain-containing protein [Nitrososphaera sp.]|uniref:vWA domain-containing protein n=1 Tax=Nitrososphaera sp. TaxID=1971748 RepID=UPI00307D9EC5